MARIKDEDKDDVVKLSDEDSMDSDSKADILDALRSAFSRLLAHQDELAHR